MPKTKATINIIKEQSVPGRRSKDTCDHQIWHQSDPKYKVSIILMGCCDFYQIPLGWKTYKY